MVCVNKEIGCDVNDFCFMISSIVFYSKVSKYILDKYNRYCKMEDLGVYRMVRLGRIKKFGFVGCWIFGW